MTADAVGVIRAVVREELRGFHFAELGVVTRAYPHESGSDANNYECDVRLRDTGLELRRLPVATSRLGVVAIPDPGDLVLVQFLRGDIHAAIVTGRLYNDAIRPPEARAREAVYVSAHPAESGVRRVYLELPNGNTLTIDDDALELEMGGTTLTIKHDGDVIVESRSKLTLRSQGDALLESQGKLELKAASDVSVKGLNVSLKAMANASIEATAAASLKGPSVKIAGMIDFSPA
jgi:phage baseplate assembly protein gpV